MNIGIVKPGQGYWVRVMTACLVAVATLACAGWTYQQGGLLADKLPKSAYELTVTLSGPPPASQQVELLGAKDRSDSQPVVGTARVASFSSNTRALKVDSVSMTSPHEIGETVDIRAIGTAAAPGAMLASLGARPEVRAVPAIEPALLQGVLAGTVLLVGSFVAYYLAGRRVKTVDFLIATDFEMKKVNWSTPREIMGSTWVVIGASILIAGSLFFFDFVFKTFFQLIGVLGR